MKKNLINFLFIVIVILGFLPFFLMPTEKESLAVGSNLVGALSPLFTLLIAVLLYSKYGTEKSLIDKQTETVLRLLTELKRTRFLCTWSGGLLQLRLDCLQDKYLDDYKDRNLVFSLGYAKGLNDIWEIADDIFLPVEIAEKIKPLTVEVITSKEKESSIDIKVAVLGYFSETKEDFFGLLNGRTINMQEFVKLWDSIIKVSKKWLNDHSNISVDLNFERK